MELGRYRVLGPLGRGGMAEVFEAEAGGAQGWQRRVAIKRLLPDHAQDAAFVGMFLDEARIASRLHHASIVSVFDYGVVDGLPFQVMELVDGLDAGRLHARGEQRGHPLPLPLALHLGTSIAHALHHAHQAHDAQGRPLGIVHRDVSPANILVSWEGDVLLTDFGIAFAKHRSERTRTGQAKGTVLYWAPEQATGGTIDARTDVFALAATLHRLIAGRSPLAGENALADLLVGRPLPLDPSLPRDVAEVLARALHRDRAHRPADAAAFAAALGACMTRRLQEDPRSAMRRWLETLRDSPAAAADAGRLDALLGLEWIVVGEDDGVRTFAAQGVAATPSPAPRDVAVAASPAATAPLPEPAAAGRTVATAPGAPGTGAPAATRGLGVLIVALVLALGGLGLATWAWIQARARPDAPVDRGLEPPRETSVPSASRSGFASTGTAGLAPASEAGPEPPVSGRGDPWIASGSGSSSTTGPRDGEGPGSSPPRARSSGGASSPGRPRSGGPRPPPAPVGRAILQIGGQGAHRAEIFIDGRSRGHAPRRLELSATRHRVVLKDTEGRVVTDTQVELRSSHTRSDPYRLMVPR